MSSHTYSILIGTTVAFLLVFSLFSSLALSTTAKGCVDKDDTNPTIDKIAAADMILFATPVYWWGMSAQLKLIIDKCYCRGLQLKNKKVGTIVVGGSPVDSIQYELIDKQFDCMAKYLSWNLLFQKSYYATAKDELSKNQDAMKELEDIGKEL